MHVKVEDYFILRFLSLHTVTPEPWKTALCLLQYCCDILTAPQWKYVSVHPTATLLL